MTGRRGTLLNFPFIVDFGKQTLRNGKLYSLA